MKTVLCYLEKDAQFLMLHRNKKKDDYNQGKWIGVGGKIEHESIEAALLREVKEETGLTLISYTFYGEVIFYQNNYKETMYLYHSNDFEGTLKKTSEGVLKFVPIKELFDLNLWQGDVLFLKKLIMKEPFDKLKLYYNHNSLVKHTFI